VLNCQEKKTDFLRFSRTFNHNFLEIKKHKKTGLFSSESCFIFQVSSTFRSCIKYSCFLRHPSSTPNSKDTPQIHLSIHPSIHPSI